MYLKDKDHRITIRLSDKQFKFLNETAKALDVKPSGFLRMVVASTMSTANMIVPNGFKKEIDKKSIAKLTKLKHLNHYLG